MVICKRRWGGLFHAVRQKWAGMLVASACLAAGVAAAGQPGHQGPRLDSIAYVVSNPEIVFAAGGGVFKSTDGGVSWVGLKTPLEVAGVVTDPHNPGRVVVVPRSSSPGPGDYLESLDGGETWSHKRIVPRSREGEGLSYPRLLMHPSSPGVWLAYGTGKLWTTRNAGVSWEAGPDLGLARSRVNLTATREAFYVHSSTQVWRSEDGKDWQSTGFPEGQELRAIEALSGDRVAVASRQGWWLRSAAGTWGHGPSSPKGHSSDLLPGEQPSPYPHAMGSHCRPAQSPADAAYLLASCSVGGYLPIPSSSQLQSSDSGVSWSRIGGEGLPSRWYPQVIAPHPHDSGILLMVWASGRIFRSHDHGATWTASDAGLAIPRSVEYMDHGSLPVFPLLEYPRETPLNKAVIADDLAAVRQLARAGVDLNERGPAGLSAVEWALMLGAHVDRPRRGDAMYWALRGLGAVVPSQKYADAEFMWSAVDHGQFGSVMEELLRSGWQLTTKLAGGDSTFLGDRARRRCHDAGEGSRPQPCVSTLAGRPLESWVDLHLSQAQPGNSAQLAIDLAALGQLGLTERVLSFDAGRYRSTQEVVQLLEALPDQAPGLRSQVFGGYQGRLDSLSGGGAIYDALKIDRMATDWLLDILPADRSPITAENAALLIQALLGPLRRPDWVRSVVRGKRGPRIDEQGWQQISDALVLGCEPGLLVSAMRAGVQLKASRGGGFLQSSVRAAVDFCDDKEASVRNAHLEVLHRAGLRLAENEIWALDVAEMAELHRSTLWPYYKRSVANVAGVGVTLDQARSGEPPRIAGTVAGFPASRVGIRSGDLLVAVNGVETQGKSMGEMVLLLRGKPGTKVALTVQRPGAGRSILHLRRKSLLSVSQPASGEK
ncbi:periplasmic protease [Acidovorax sp. CF316]|uniref:PDZ domain-containing protein n=1 Tax=Acidovorax sp. CF316 TaxID=1144317 RepID=UPI00026BE2B9|nr:PDZ domain-containing protein [Acidovorax sp. CF316]EJE49939.1 periplasmic protease [Acidovorax sp. CF316]